ncbi:MAG TPA: hypothetical protein VFF71_01410 [Luteimonas sp.]|nr:hypothetical protein [Luteimonas sp.]
MHDGDTGVRPQQDVYASPRAPVGDVGRIRFDATRTAFHVVSLRKFWCLYLATFGLYQYFWLYRHWEQYRDWHREPLWPAARSIFSIFFMHALNRHVDDALRTSRTVHAWRPVLSATMFVVLSIVSAIVGRVAARVDAMTQLDYLGIALLLPVGMAMAATQRAANAACQDPGGSANARLTAANWLWIVLGCLLWTLILIGLLAPGAPP